MSAVHALRRLVFGETWTLPIGIGLAVGAAAVVRLTTSTAWLQAASGFLLFGLLVAALWGSLPARAPCSRSTREECRARSDR